MIFLDSICLQVKAIHISHQNDINLKNVESDDFRKSLYAIARSKSVKSALVNTCKYFSVLTYTEGRIIGVIIK